MSLTRRLAAHVFALALAASLSGTAGAQSISLRLSGGVRDSISPAPVIDIFAEDVAPDLQPAFVRLFISTGSPFQTALTVKLAAGTSAQFLLDSLLPSSTRVFFRSQLLDRNGNVRAERIDTANVRSWVRLITPTGKTQVFFTRQPRFVWSSPPITLPPGPWIYRLDLINTAHSDRPEQSYVTRDTSLVPQVPLNACTSYGLSVTATAENGARSDRITLIHSGTFVIQSADCPSATISYYNFPNPFGRGTTSDKTCFWFDLAHRTTVRLTIFDIRLREVKRLVPGAMPALLDSGAYGRQGSEQSGCDPRLAWDGTDDRGRRVPQGVYIAVFEADGRRETKKLFYRGP